jgi:hypothetical protein
MKFSKKQLDSVVTSANIIANKGRRWIGYVPTLAAGNALEEFGWCKGGREASYFTEDEHWNMDAKEIMLALAMVMELGKHRGFKK